jgi:hypothetical protein
MSDKNTDTKETASTPTESGTVPKSSLTSAVRTDLPNTPGPSGENVDVDLSKAKISVPPDAIAQPEPEPAGTLSEGDKATVLANAKSYESRAAAASIGLVQVEGIDFRYIGEAPAREYQRTGKPVETPGGFRVGPENSRFTPISSVGFDPSIRIKDPATGEFYYPADGVTSYDHVELEGSELIPTEPDKKVIKANEKALLEARNR